VASPTNAISATRVTIRLLKFSPDKIEVKSGERVEWANADLTPHTATAQGIFNSGAINAGASWSHTFNQPGTFPYVCTFHPEMKGIVVVH
jgi:plastocyanin